MMFDLAELQAAAAATEGAECSTEEGTARVQTKSIVRVQSKALHKLHIALKIAVLKVQASRV